MFAFSYNYFQLHWLPQEHSDIPGKQFQKLSEI